MTTKTPFPSNVKDQDFELELDRYLVWCLQHDAIAEFNGLNFPVSDLDGRENLAGAVFEECFFPRGIKLTNMTNAKIVDFGRCRFLSTSGIDIERVAATTLYCRNLIFIDDEEEDEYWLKLGAAAEAIRIRNSAFEHMIIADNNCHVELHKTYIAKEIKVSGIRSSDEPSSIHFSEVTFHDPVAINIERCELDQLVLQECHSEKEKSDYSSLLSLMGQRVRRLSITGSALPNFTIDARNSRIGRVEVSSSSIGRELDLRMAATFEESERTIGSVKVVDSFLGQSLFEGRVLNDPLNFAGTTFGTPPQLHGVNIPPGSIFPDRSGFLSREGEDVIKAYRTLRFAMEGQRARSEEGMFFVLEQETVLHTQYRDWRQTLSFNFWYGLLSEYGTNAARPMYALLILGLLSAVIYAVISSPALNLSYPVDWALLRGSVLFSLQQICTPFLALRELKSPVAGANDASFFLTLVAAVESLASVILITLGVLALRWEFKRG